MRSDARKRLTAGGSSLRASSLRATESGAPAPNHDPDPAVAVWADALDAANARARRWVKRHDEQRARVRRVEAVLDDLYRSTLDEMNWIRRDERRGCVAEVRAAIEDES